VIQTNKKIIYAIRIESQAVIQLPNVGLLYAIVQTKVFLNIRSIWANNRLRLWINTPISILHVTNICQHIFSYKKHVADFGVLSSEYAILAYIPKT